MTDAITGTGAASAAGATSGGAAMSSATTLNKDDFLKLLVAQLRYQDPTKPADSSQFLAETAQFSLVEKFDQLAEADKQLLASTQTQTATAMVGRAITWSDDAGSHSGTVTAVTFANGTPKLRVGQLEVGLDAVTSVAAADTTS